MTEVANKLRMHIENAIYDADRNWSKIKIEKIHTLMPGMNSPRVRHLLNNLCSLDKTVYLDLGTYRGASLISAMWANEGIKAYAVDKYDFDPYEAKPYNPEGVWNSVLKAVKEKLDLYKLKDNATIVISDIQKLTKKEIPDKVNVVYYDASPNADVINKTVSALSKITDLYFILVVSNTQNQEITKAFESAFEKNDFKVYWDTVLKSRVLDDKKTWWNGIKIYVLSNTKAKKED